MRQPHNWRMDSAKHRPINIANTRDAKFNKIEKLVRAAWVTNRIWRRWVRRVDVLIDILMSSVSYTIANPAPAADRRKNALIALLCIWALSESSRITAQGQQASFCDDTKPLFAPTQERKWWKWSGNWGSQSWIVFYMYVKHNEGGAATL
jgi:hypothetical protein